MKNIFRNLTGLTPNRAADVRIVLEDFEWEHGTCSVCGCQASRGTGGQWWHVEITDAIVCPQFGASFVAPPDEARE